MDKEIMSTKQMEEYISSLHDKILNGIHVAICPNCMARMMIIPKEVKRITTEIPLKLPSLNEYINACRTNRYSGAKMKKAVEDDIMWYLKKLPKFDKPVKIHFHWIEGNKKRDLDNICFAKKFILDAMVKAGKLKDDNRRCVTAFTDTFEYGKETKVILKIEECDET